MLIVFLITGDLSPLVVYPVNNTNQYFASLPATINVTFTVDATQLTEMKNLTYTLNTTAEVPFYDKYLTEMLNLDNTAANGEGANTVAFDASTYAKNGVCYGGNCNWTTAGAYGGGINFGGAVGASSNWINITAPVAQLMSDNFTVEFWMKPSSYMGTGTYPRAVISRTIDASNQWVMFLGNDTNLCLAARNCLIFTTHDGGTNYGVDTTSQYTGTGLATNTWYYVVGIWDTNANVPILYINGVAITPSAASTGWGVRTVRDSRIYIGGTSVKGFQYAGTLDEIRVWNRSLSATEIAAHYKANLNKYNTTEFFFQSNETLNAGLDIGKINTWNTTNQFTYTSNWSMNIATTTTTLASACGFTATGDWVYSAGTECIISSSQTKTSGDSFIRAAGSTIIIDNAVVRLESGAKWIIENGAKLIFRNNGKVCGGTSCG